MKKKIALLLVLMISLFSMISGFDTTEVKADGEEITSVTPPTPRP